MLSIKIFTTLPLFPIIDEFYWPHLDCWNELDY
jgi:hypothetical protein